MIASKLSRYETSTVYLVESTVELVTITCGVNKLSLFNILIFKAYVLDFSLSTKFVYIV